MERKIKRKKERHFSPLGLIFAAVLVFGFGIGSYFLYTYVIGPAIFNNEVPTTKPDTESEKQYNKLLTILNSGLEPEETKADSLLSFSYKDDHFYISGRTTEKVYLYDVDIGGQVDTKKALDFVLANDLTTDYTITLTRFNVTTSSEFDAKYVTEGVTGKYSFGEQGSISLVFATLKSGEDIVIMNNVSLSTTLVDSYSPVKIVANNPLFKIYNYIVGK